MKIIKDLPEHNHPRPGVRSPGDELGKDGSPSYFAGNNTPVSCSDHISDAKAV